MLKVKDGETLRLERRVYEIGNGETENCFYALSNNDACVKRIALHIQGKKNVTVNGNGAVLLCKDFITAIGVADSQDVTLRDLTIDYCGSRHMEVLIGKTAGNVAEVFPRHGFSFQTDGGLTSNGERVEKTLIMQFDGKALRPCYRLNYRFANFAGGADGFYQSAEIYKENGKYFIRIDEKDWLQEGNVLMIAYADRSQQAIFVHNSKHVRLENVTVCYSPSMGIMCQLSDDISLKNVTVAVNGKHGVLSTLGDAAHFTQCGGNVEIDSGRFFNMMDDAVNVHGNYTVVERVDGNTLTAKIMHRQQQGVNVLPAGDRITAYVGKTIDERARFVVTESEMVGMDEIRLQTDGVTSVVVGDTLYNGDRMPAVTITRTACGNNRPRGFLITTPKCVEIRGCRFSNCEHGIECAGDTSYWFESGGCRDVTVEDCTFDNCNYTDGQYPIVLRPTFDKSGKEKFYHKNITVRNNRFVGFTGGMVWARNVQGLVVENNTYVFDDTFPKEKAKDGKFSVVDCEFIQRNNE